MSTSELQLLSDLPIGETGSLAKDGLNFQKYAEVLGEVAINTTGPFTIGIFGEWGTGKTSLMKLIEGYLSRNKSIATIWFNAWRFEKEDEPLFPLIATIIREIEKNSEFLDVLKDKGKSLLTALRAVAYGFTGELEVDVPGVGKVKGKFVAKDMIDRVKELSNDPIRNKSIYIDAYDALSNINIPDTSKIVIIIDDLDRCFPDHAIKLLESIKLILNQPGFIFIIGVARNIIEGIGGPRNSDR
jgi:predicted KAP-like P-loop ATPase